jgi:hypothetical protein
MTEQAAQASIERACWMLRLPAICGNFFDLAGVAAREQVSCLRSLSELVLAPPRCCPASLYAEGNRNREF